MTLDEIRAGIVARRDAAQERIDAARVDRDNADSALAGFDSAVAAMPNGAAKPGRAKRRDIAALVREALTAEAQTVAQIAEKTGVPPSRVLPALGKVGRHTSQGWMLP